MTIRSDTHFTFNGRQSDEFGIISVNMQSGMQSEQFAARRTIREQRIRGKSKPYFMGVDLDPLEFTLSLAFENGFTTDTLREVAKWLLSPKYFCPLVFGSDPDRIFYALCVDDSDLIHNCNDEGYLEVNFRCADAYSYTGVYETIVVSNDPTFRARFIFDNIGDVECQPIVEIFKIDSGDLTIYNESNGNAFMRIKGMQDGETVRIDCENHDITTDIPLTNRYDSLEGDYLKIPVYENHMLIEGKAEVKFIYQFKRIQ